MTADQRRKLNSTSPAEVRFDKAGNVYFVEMKNNLVRKVDAKTGIISTVAGTGELGFSGDGGLGNEGDVQSSALNYARQ